MAHLVSLPRPDVVYSLDIAGGRGGMLDLRHHQAANLSPEATAILEQSLDLRERVVEHAVLDGVTEAVETLELVVRAQLAPDCPESAEAEQDALEALADMALQAWLAEEQERQ